MANIRKVSEKAGVSVATVSRVLNHPGTVSENTRNRVIQVMKEMNYVPNSVARSLAIKKTSTIGLVVPNILNPLYPKVAKGVEDVVYQKGYNILLCNSEYDAEREKDSIGMLLSKKVDGLIITSTLLNIEEIKKIKEQGVPFVIIGNNIEDQDMNIVYTDYFLGAYLATSHLIHIGYKNIFHVSGPLDKKESIAKLDGYKNALEEENIGFRKDWVIEGNNEIEGGYLAFKKLLKLKDKSDAIFAANDLMAYGIINAIKASGFEVPKDYAVVGFDDINMSSIVEPKLTTVVQPVYKMGLTAARILMDDIENGYEENLKQKIYIQPTLKIRKSCRLNDRIQEIFS